MACAGGCGFHGSTEIPPHKGLFCSKCARTMQNNPSANPENIRHVCQKEADQARAERDAQQECADVALQAEMQGRGYPVVDSLKLKLAYNAYMKMHGWSGNAQNGTWATPAVWGKYGTAMNCFMHKGVRALAEGDVYGQLRGAQPLPGCLAKSLVDSLLSFAIGYARDVTEADLQQLSTALNEQMEATTTFTDFFGDERAALADLFHFFVVAARESLRAK